MVSIIRKERTIHLLNDAAQVVGQQLLPLTHLPMNGDDDFDCDDADDDDCNDDDDLDDDDRDDDDDSDDDTDSDDDCDDHDIEIQKK